MSFIEFLKRLDKIFFLLINHDSYYRYFDPIMVVLRNPVSWIPLYMFMIFYIIKKTGNRAWIFIVLSLVTVVLTDSCSGLLLKPLFSRVRPCYDPEIHQFVRNLVDCGGMYSFPSSHAANHFGLAAFWFWSLWKITGKKWKWLWLWASLISYAQIYVGQHYPFDVAAGAFLGWVIGILVARIFEYLWNYEINFKRSYLAHQWRILSDKKSI